MESITTLYQWVHDTREVLFAYCETLPPGVYTEAHPGFAGKSIRDLHVHVAGCYTSWLGSVGLEEGHARLRPEDHPDVAAVRRSFAVADTLVERLAERFAGQLDARLQRKVRWQEAPVSVTPLWLLSHTITHEFHHKGQIVSLGRQLGHPVGVDTDLALP